MTWFGTYTLSLWLSHPLSLSFTSRGSVLFDLAPGHFHTHFHFHFQSSVQWIHLPSLVIVTLSLSSLSFTFSYQWTHLPSLWFYFWILLPNTFTFIVCDIQFHWLWHFHRPILFHFQSSVDPSAWSVIVLLDLAPGHFPSTAKSTQAK